MGKNDTVDNQDTGAEKRSPAGGPTKGFRFTWHYIAALVGLLVVIIGGYFLYSQWKESDAEYYAMHQKMGLSYLRQGQWEPAIEEFEKAAKARPGSFEPPYGLGMAYFRQRKLDEAVNYYEKALALAPTRLDIRYSLGLAYQETGRLEKALEVYHVIVKEDKGAYMVFNNVGIIQMKLGDYEKAVGALQHSIELNPNYYPAYFNLAMVYEAGGKADLASKQYQSIIERASKRSETKKIAEDAKKLLSKLNSAENQEK